jgi:type II secretory ATPase GspE/PulE/Tfp pilus assembly ATPase PilB-like protein
MSKRCKGKRQTKTKYQPADVVELVQELLDEAIICGASDIHFEPTEQALIVKYRLDGMLHVVECLPQAISENVIARLKVLGDLLTYRNDVPQEGRINIPKNLQNQVTDQRLAIFPTINGQRAVVRLLYQDEQLVNLGQLGFTDGILQMLEEFACQTQGILLLTGPAGSGKSTTLAALMRHILQSTPGRSIVALEDPVEIHIDGVTQVQITPYGDMTFPVALRSLLRQDPQVLMLGEIRDAETAKIAIEAGLTGHLLASTMHSGSPAGALLRLLEMGIEPYQITSGIAAVINQRLIRRLCDQCKQETPPNGYKPVGCDQCMETGFKGRILLAEAFRLDTPLRKAILDRADQEEIETLLSVRGHETMFTHGERLISQGLTSRDELIKVLGIR